MVVVRSYRLLFALLIVAAIATQYAGAPPAGAFAVVNFFSFFTILSNLLVAAVFAAAAFAPSVRTDWWRGLAVVCMVITGVVFALLLRGLPLVVIPWVNAVLHEIAPLAVLADWIAVPPLRRIGGRAAARWLIAPAIWLAYTLLRGAGSGWYPYPFLNAGTLGAAAVSAYCLAIFAGFVVTIAAVVALGNRKAPRV